MKRDLTIAIVAVLIIAAAAFGLSTMSRDLALTPSAPHRATKEPSPAKSEKKLAPNEKVVMRVNGEPITDREFTALMQAAPPQQRTLFTTPQGRRVMADELVKLKALEQEAERMGIADDPAVKMQLDMTRAQIVAGRALEKLVDRRSEGLIRKAYESQKGQNISLRHIAIAYEGGQMPARDPNVKLTLQQAMAKAQAVARQIRGGVDFATTAAAVSDDIQSGADGGKLGPVKMEMLPEDIRGPVSKLKPGEMSDPVRTQYAVHLFKVEPSTLEDLRPMLAQEVRQQAAQEEMERIQKSAKVELDPKFFPPGPPGSSSQPQAPKTRP